MRLHLPVRVVLSAGLLLIAVSTVAQAQGFTLLTMDEVPTQPIPTTGLTVKNVTFSCDVANCATYNTYNGGQIRYVQDPAIRGNVTSVLTITLNAPSTHLQFGVALSTFSPVTAAMTVQLKDPSGANIGGPVTLNTVPIVSYTEGFFVANTAGRTIGSAVLSFNTAAGATEFGLDNLAVTPFDGYLRFFY